MKFRLPVNWFVTKYLRTNLGSVCEFGPNSIVVARNIYSLTKVWPPKYNRKTSREIEKFWNPKIQEENTKREKSQFDKDKHYVLSMFPYPSGKLHMGHVRVYTLSDCMARYHRLKGKQVIHPMGWDAFGLPAENAAIERGEMPDKWTHSNIESMRSQLEELQCSFNWDREISTCDPSYYKWSQFIFLKMYDAGLVYQKEGPVNWDPVDQTVLANEQIDEHGHSWRSGAKVEKRYLRQWFIRTTAYAKSLYDGLENVNKKNWKDIIDIQKEWIGKCTGTRLDFVLKNEEESMEDPLSVFTEHPEALYGISHIVLSPQHRYNDPLYKVDQNRERTGEGLPISLHCVHPITGDRIPLIISDRVDFHEKCDSHLGIPSICQCDRDTAEKFGFNFKEVIDSDGKLVNSGQFTDLTREKAREEVCKYAKEKGIGGHMVSSKLNDWLISRQRYWGTPIPMIHCPNCKIVPVPYQDLPVLLPRLETLTKKGLSPLEQSTDWFNVKCPKCGNDAVRETDTMDTFVDSSWYFLRYLDPSNNRLPFDKDKADRLMPVDLYIGGKEHATLHLYFARFFNHFLCDAGYLIYREPFTNLLVQGMVLGQSYRVKGTGQYLKPEEVEFSNSKAPVEKSTGKSLFVEWEKMSKSKYNGVDPQEIIDEFGVSATRMAIVYNVAPQSDRRWSNTEFKGVMNWKNKVWNLVTMVIHNYGEVEKGDYCMIEWNKKVSEIRNIQLAEINYNFEVTFMISVAITAMQQLTEFLRTVPVEVAVNSDIFLQTLADIIIMISPISPAFSKELWEGFRNNVKLCPNCDVNKAIENQTWPALNMDSCLILLVKCNNTIVYDVAIPYTELNTLTQKEAREYSQGHHLFKEHFEGHEIKRVTMDIKQDYRATIEYFIPSADSSVIKKLSKQRKKF